MPIIIYTCAAQKPVRGESDLAARRQAIGGLGLRVLKSTPSSPVANAICERVIGTIRRECVDGLIPVSESHPRSILKEWVTYYNRARPHLTGYTIKVVPAPQRAIGCSAKLPRPDSNKKATRPLWRDYRLRPGKVFLKTSAPSGAPGTDPASLRRCIVTGRRRRAH